MRAGILYMPYITICRAAAEGSIAAQPTASMTTKEGFPFGNTTAYHAEKHYSKITHVQTYSDTSSYTYDWTVANRLTHPEQQANRVVTTYLVVPSISW